MMMSYEDWLNRILQGASDIGSRAFQEQTWKAGGDLISSPDEVYQNLMEDCRPDLFFETYGETLDASQVQSWKALRASLEGYYDRMPLHPDPTDLLNDPEWDLVRQAARRFLQTFGSQVDDRSE